MHSRHTDEDDYQHIHGSQQERQLTYSNRRASADVKINIDSMYEGVEEFSLELYFASPQTGFFVSPNIATVTVLNTIVGE